MSRRGQVTDLAERVEIGERWKSGQTDRQIAEAMQRPAATVRKWRRRNQRQGRAGLSSRMGRPATGALSQYPEEVRLAISEMKKAHPGWGPMTIRLELQKMVEFAGKPLPSRSRIAAYLKQKGLVKLYERHRDLPEPKPEPMVRPHQEWEVDAQGCIPVGGLGSAVIINITDVVSHLKIDSLPCLRRTHVDTCQYQLVLRRAFVQYGLPEQISLDHDSVFYDNRCPSPFPTALHLWLIGLGIVVRFIHRPPPAEHARIERSHQTIARQAVLGQTFETLAGLQTTLNERMDFLNCEYPSRSLHGKAPFMVYPHARQSNRPYRLEWERDCLDMRHVYDYLAQGRWFRHTSATGAFCLGAQRYNARTRFALQTLEITFDPVHLEFVCLPEKELQTFRLTAQGLTKEALLGELDPLTSAQAYQLSLPFTPQAWHEILLCQVMTGTTL